MLQPGWRRWGGALLENARVTGERILILEDDDALRETLAEVLELRGYQVDSVGRADEAIRAAREAGYDIIVADIRMEGLSGLDAIEQVKKDCPSIATMVVTGYSTEADSIRAIQLGVGNYLKKPFRPQVFLEAVEALLTRRREQVRREDRNRATRQTILWALETATGSFELGRESGFSALEAARLAEQSCRRMGLDSEQAELVKAATLLCGLRRQDSLAGLPAFLVQAQPEAVEALAAQIEEQGEQIPLGARIGAACLGEDRGAYESALAEKVRGWRDAADPLPEAGEESEREAGQRRRARLSLARTLLQGGDANALAALQELAGEVYSREGAQASLLLGRYAVRENQFAEAVRHFQEAVARARDLGPGADAGIGLEAALALGALGREEAAGLLQEVRGRLRHQGETPALALATLGAWHFAGSPAPGDEVRTSLRALLQPEALHELESSADWLLPFLCAHQSARPDAVVEQALLALAGEMPGHFASALDARQPEGMRLTAVQALASASHPRAREMLAALEADPHPEIRERVRTTQLLEAPKPPLMRVYSLGRFEVYQGEDRVENWHGRKVRFLFACLASRWGRPVSDDLLMEAFWPEDLDRARSNLQVAASHLRRGLRPANWIGDINYVLRNPLGLYMNPELPHWNDLDELEKALRDAGSGSDEVALEALRKVPRLYRGPYLDGCYMEWALTIRTRLEAQVQDAMVRLCRLLGQRDRHEECLEMCKTTLELDPCLQDVHVRAMQSMLALDRAEQVVKHFQSAKKTLWKEMALEPSIPMMEQHQRALLKL